MMLLLCSLAVIGPPNEDRAEVARAKALPILQEYAAKHKIAYPFQRVLLRAFKQEKLLEIWAGDSGKPMSLIHAWPIAAASGSLGPKRKEGDRQVPEGFYGIDVFNPRSTYHLSMRVGYPNASDKMFADSAQPGGDIYIHGDRKSIGCLAMTDPVIDILYTACWDAAHGKANSPHLKVLILPFQQKPAAEWPPEHSELWGQLQKISHWFDRHHTLPAVSVDASGAYRLVGDDSRP